ncbi:MAG: phosphoketolase, partial [Betaproteobacteria bacterium]|nr:phosphoketolase [Betaproteobacteria bacterium]
MSDLASHLTNSLSSGAPEQPERELLRDLNDYWHAALYLCAGMIYLRENPLLKVPLQQEHIKQRLLGHWGSDPGQAFAWVHLNRLINAHDLNVLFVSGPGHGAPAVLAQAYLEGTYGE